MKTEFFYNYGCQTIQVFCSTRKTRVNNLTLALKDSNKILRNYILFSVPSSIHVGFGGKIAGQRVVSKTILDGGAPTAVRFVRLKENLQSATDHI